MSADATLAFRSATELARMVRTRAIGCLELLEHYLDRVKRFDPIVNAIVVKDIERARARAIAADDAIGAGNAIGPLHGVPMTVKECFQLTGTPTTYGVVAYRDNIAVRNAVAVDRLIAAGANIFGKTNVPPWLADGQSANEIYGRTNNPWDIERTPGGSSGGSAAALAAGLTGLELGSDIASSIRNPAHYCGVFGHKTTYGVASVYGKSLAPSSWPEDISVIGPLARSAVDLELALSVISGADEGAPSAMPFCLPSETRSRLRDFRVAVVYDDDFASVDRDVSDQLHRLAEFLDKQGVRVREARPDFDSLACYRIFMTLMRSASAHRPSENDYARLAERAVDLDPAQTDMQTIALHAATLSHRAWLQLNNERRQLQDRWSSFFHDYDLLLCPPLSTAAHVHTPEEPAQRTLMVNGQPVPYGRQLFWAGFAGVAYLPATVAPIRLTPTGLPVGVQIIGPAFHDLRCIAFAKLLESEYRAFVPPPAFH
jgi:amidase